METSDSIPLQTFPRRLLAHAQQRGARPAFREKYLGIWQNWSWLQVNAEVRALACGLAALGFKRGTNLAIIGDNRPRLYWAMLAAQCLGGVPVPLYQDAPSADMAHVLNDADIEFAVVEDQEQVDKLLEIRTQCPRVRHIVFEDRAACATTGRRACALREAAGAGPRMGCDQPGVFDAAIEAGQGSDTAIMLYTSGTTGKPKGVMQSHAALIAAGSGGVGFDKLTDREDILSYLPMAWVGDYLFSLAQAMVAGFTVNCPESGDTVLPDLREIGPTYYFAPPRVFENMLTSVMIRMEDASAIKRRMFDYFMAGGAPQRRRDPGRQAGQRRRAFEIRAGQGCGLRTIEKRARTVARARRLHGGRRHRSRPVPLLPLDRRQSETVIRLDRNLRLCLPAAGREHQVRQRRRAGARGRGQNRRERRSVSQRRAEHGGYFKRPDATAEVIDGEDTFIRATPACSTATAI